MHLLNVKIHSDRFPSRRFYPFNIQAMDEPQELVFHRPVVFFLGENGSGLLPILGVPLPLVSCGGTSLLAVLASVGVLLNIATNRRSFIVATPERRKRAHSSRGHGRPHGARSGGR